MTLAGIQNALYMALGGKGNIAEETSDDEFYVSGNKALYMQYGTAEKIEVNGKTIAVPSIRDTDNTAYPAWFNSNALYMGDYSDEKVSVKGLSGGAFTLVDIDRAKELGQKLSAYDNEVKAGKNTLSLKVMGTDDRKTALLPVYCDPGWHASVNGRSVQTENICGLFTGVPIGKGENVIKMYFIPQGLIPGILITLSALLLTFVFNRRKVSLKESASRASASLLYAVWSIAVLLLYVIPIICFIIHEIVKRI